MHARESAIKLHQVRYFPAAAESGSFRRAAAVRGLKLDVAFIAGTRVCQKGKQTNLWRAA